MFSAGTRVKIYISSESGKKHGPKKHSVGYVSQSSTPYHVHVKGFPIDNQPFMITPLSIVFTRYGREMRSRRETRGFLQITPTFGANHQCTPKEVDNVLKILRRGELTKNPKWLSMAHDYVPYNAMGVALPTESASVHKMGKDEALAWVKSVLMNTTFQGLVSKNKALPTLQAVMINSDVLAWVANATRKTSARNSMFEWAADTMESMNQLVRTMRALKTVFDKSSAENSLKGMIKRMEGGSKIDFDAFVHWYTSNLLDTRSMGFSKRHAVRPRILDQRTVNFVSNIETTRRTYLTHKPKQV